MKQGNTRGYDSAMKQGTTRGYDCAMKQGATRGYDSAMNRGTIWRYDSAMILLLAHTIASYCVNLRNTLRHLRAYFTI